MANTSFQKTVNRTLAAGQPGNQASQAPRTVTAYLAMNDVTPGTFVINYDTLTTPAVATGSARTPKRAGYSTGATDGILAGLVTRDSTGLINNLTDSFSPLINAGLNVQVASQGEYMVELAEIKAGTATLGMQVDVEDFTTGVPTVVADGSGNVNWWLCEILDSATGLGVISTWRKA